MRHDWTPVEMRFGHLPDRARWLPLLERHASLVEDAAKHTNLTAVAPEDMVLRHYMESLGLLDAVLRHQAGPQRVVDIGSGAGFPGLVFASLLPQAHHTLIEPRARRAAFLSSAAEDMELSNVEVACIRAEEGGRAGLRHRADVVTARAVAPLAVLIEYGAPLTATGGVMAFPKGSRLAEELDDAAIAASELKCELVEVANLGDHLSVVVLRQREEAPPRYPRRTGVAARRPLGSGRSPSNSA